MRAHAAGLAVALAALPGCGGGPAPETLVLTGSSTVAPLMVEVGRRFEAGHPGTRVDVQTGGSSRGIRDVRAGLATIGMVSRALKAEEGDLHGHPIARDGICLITHAENPVRELTRDQVIVAYRGEARNWEDLGGPDAPVVIVHKAEGRSTLELFLKYCGLKNSEVRADVVIGDNEQGIKTVAGNPAALGYVSIGAAQHAAGSGVPIRLLPIGGVEASIASVRAGRFPLARPLLLVTREPPAGTVKELLDFARSPEVHDLVRAQYFVPLGP